MTINEAATLWAVSPITVRRWIKEGRIKAEKRLSGKVEVWHVLEQPNPKEDAQTVTEAPSSVESSDVLQERIKGLEALLEMHRAEIEHKNSEIKALIATTARMSEINAELQTKALPIAEKARKPWWKIKGD